MGIDERLDNIDKAINKLYHMFFRLLAILLVLGKLNPEYVEDILSIVKETDDE